MDMMTILDVIAVLDNTSDEDFWSTQTHVEIPRVPRPKSFLHLIPKAEGSLRGKRIGAPKMYIGEHDQKAKRVATSQDVIDLWKSARRSLEALGATVLETDFPLATNYEDESATGQANHVVGFKPEWNGKERGELVAYLWDDFLKKSGDLKFSNGLASVDGSLMFPRPPGLIPDKYMEHRNFMDYPGLVELAKKRNDKSIWEIDGIAEALPALEAQRKRDFEEWMDKQQIDLVVFPANGDMGRANVDFNDESAKHALQNGVRYSNGNRAIRHMGVPTISVTMGLANTSQMPVNLTFIGKHGQDSDLLKYAFAFEHQSRRRVAPPVTPPIESDRIQLRGAGTESRPSVFRMRNISAKKTNLNNIRIEGTFEVAPSWSTTIEAYVDGQRVSDAAFSLSGGQWSFDAEFVRYPVPEPPYGGVGQVVGYINIIVLAHSGDRTIGELVQIPQDAEVEKM